MIVAGDARRTGSNRQTISRDLSVNSSYYKPLTDARNLSKIDIVKGNSILQKSRLSLVNVSTDALVPYAS